MSLLAAAGLLDGRIATTHWGLVEEYRDRFPEVDWRPDEIVTEDGGVYTGGGVYAALDLAVYLVEKLRGRELALQASRSLLTPWRAAGPWRRQAGASSTGSTAAASCRFPTKPAACVAARAFEVPLRGFHECEQTRRSPCAGGSSGFEPGGRGFESLPACPQDCFAMKGL